MKLRVAVVNLQSGIGITKGYREYVTRGWKYLLGHSGKGVKLAAQMLHEEKPDLVLVSEIDEPSRRSRFKSQVQALKEATHLEHAEFFPTKVVGTAIQEGSAIFSHLPFQTTKRHALKRGVNPRVLGHAEIILNNQTVHVFTAHLALNAKARAQQIQDITSILKSITEPIILGGDFNERRDILPNLFQDIGLTGVTEPGYPSWKPRHALQAAFFSGHFTIARKYQPTSLLFSDHIPLIIEAEFV